MHFLFSVKGSEEDEPNASGVFNWLAGHILISLGDVGLSMVTEDCMGMK